MSFKFWRIVPSVIAATALAWGVNHVNEHASLWCYTEGPGAIREKFALVLTGIIAHQQWPHTSTQGTLEKKFWPDAAVSGHMWPESSLLTLWGSTFEPRIGSNWWLRGEVYKSWLNWEVTQLSRTTYMIDRVWPEVDWRIIIEIKDGTIKGKYVRYGIHFDWGIHWKYDDTWKFTCDIAIPLALDMTLKGIIQDHLTDTQK